MKANQILFSTLAVTLVSAYTMSPSDFLAHSKSFKGRLPASETSAKPVAKKPVAKKPVTSKEMVDLKAKLAKLEADLKDKEIQLDQKAKEVELLKSAKTEEKIEALNKLIVDQKADIEKLRSDIKNSEVKDIKIVNQNKTSVEVVVCKSESKGEKLEAELKKLLEDKELVLKQVDGLKKENDELKSKVSSASVKDEKKEEVKKDEDKKDEDKKDDEKVADAKSQKKKAQKLEDSDVVSLMSQMTTMFSAQMQSQMQVQMQMLSMLSSMQFNQAPQYTWDWSQGNNRVYGIHENIGQGQGIGIPASQSWNNFNPYSQLPQMSRQPAQQSDFGFDFGPIPQANFMRGFDFNQSPAAQPSQPALPQMQRQQMPSLPQTIAV
jgi:hypothetical protein